MTRARSFVRVTGSAASLLATPVLVNATPTEDQYAFLEEDDEPDPEALAYERAKMRQAGLPIPGEDGPSRRGRSSKKSSPGRAADGSNKRANRRKRRAAARKNKKKNSATEDLPQADGNGAETTAASTSAFVEKKLDAAKPEGGAAAPSPAGDPIPSSTDVDEKKPEQVVAEKQGDATTPVNEGVKDEEGAKDAVVPAPPASPSTTFVQEKEKEKLVEKEDAVVEQKQAENTVPAEEKFPSKVEGTAGVAEKETPNGTNQAQDGDANAGTAPANEDSAASSFMGERKAGETTESPATGNPDEGREKKWVMADFASAWEFAKHGSRGLRSGEFQAN
ncbi:unnamed protein product [Amoebophrya sp. A120]|nr:unnamed protein product [Amoebophrya sp. A120]|eukprot:GSA120T00009908001.1